MGQFLCEESNNSPKWSIIDLFAWKLLPARFGGGVQYIQTFKDEWVRNNRLSIASAARRSKIPPELLAGVCWIEVGGDPSFIDRVAFEIRSFDWSGPPWVDRYLTITNNPAKTSFGPVSIQVRTAARTLGLEPSEMSTTLQRSLAMCLERDVFNIDVVALHLRQLIDHDGFHENLPNLTMDQVRVVGARYNRGIGLSVDEIKNNLSYGNFIVKNWGRFSVLIG